MCYVGNHTRSALNSDVYERKVIALGSIIPILIIHVYTNGDDIVGDQAYPNWMKSRPWTIKLADWVSDHWKKGKLMWTLKRW